MRTNNKLGLALLGKFLLITLAFVAYQPSSIAAPSDQSGKVQGQQLAQDDTSSDQGSSNSDQGSSSDDNSGDNSGTDQGSDSDSDSN
jgi:hypothetical protein